MNYLKYLVYAMVLYLLFTFIPKNKIYLIDLLTMVASLIAFNVAYDLLEMTFNKSVLEGYDPRDNTALFNEVNSYDSNLRYGFDQKFQELSPYANIENKEELDVEVEEQVEEQVEEPSKIKGVDPKQQVEKKVEDVVEEDNKVSQIETVSKEENIKQSVMQQEPSETPKEKEGNVIAALETSKNSNLASLELTKEDDNKKDKLKYKENDTFKRQKDFIHGYSYMHTDNWSLPMQRQSVCKNPKPCKVCPRQTKGFDKDLMKWNVKN